MYFVYIIQSMKDNSFYVGYTGNIDSRVREHNFGRTGYTKKKRPWKLIYYEKLETEAQAINREKYLKKLKSRIALEKIIRESGP